MAWVAVDEDGTERIFENIPLRTKIPTYFIHRDRKYWGVWCDSYSAITLPHGSIQKLIGRLLSWDNEPEELK